ncbi:DNA-directed RNA polymerase III subunit rpc8-like [Apium graveolens]|uniref:DNA-directed RNA polymerase III subunit rpc8-like n=1 Tax=Apium graveolens TaxID=4045 RepID=UPI003D7946D7
MQQRCRRGSQHPVVISFQTFQSSDQAVIGFQRRPTLNRDTWANEAVAQTIISNFIFLQVVANLGLVVPVYDIQYINGGFVFLSDVSDGASTYTLSFRLVIFRPFVGEVVTAKLLESTPNDLRYNVF